MSCERPHVGVGVIIENHESNTILTAKRIGSHAPYWSIPGGSLEPGEPFEVGAEREVFEEHGIRIRNLSVIGVTNNLETYRKDKIHYISVIVVAAAFGGEPRIMEPDKCEALMWIDPRDPPMPHFDASLLGIGCYLQKKPFVGLSA